MAIDLEARLKSYAIVHVETVVKEYNAQMGKWKAYQNLVVDAQIAAKEDIKKFLSDIQKESAEREARWAKYSMFAMSLIGLAGVSFMSGIIQYKLYPEFIDKMSNPALKNLTADYGRAVAKVFGDAIGKTTGMGIDAVFSAVIPAQRVNNARPVQLETAISGGNLTSYRTKQTPTAWPTDPGCDSIFALIRGGVAWRANLH